MKDWKRIAEASGFGIPEADIERIAPSLDGLEAAFRPLLESVPHETEPAMMFVCAREEGQ